MEMITMNLKKIVALLSISTIITISGQTIAFANANSSVSTGATVDLNAKDATNPGCSSNSSDNSTNTNNSGGNGNTASSSSNSPNASKSSSNNGSKSSSTNSNSSTKNSSSNNNETNHGITLKKITLSNDYISPSRANFNLASSYCQTNLYPRVQRDKTSKSISLPITIIDPSYTAIKSFTTKSTDIDIYGNKTIYTWTTITPKVYAKVVNGNDNLKHVDTALIDYFWNMKGPATLPHRDSSGNFTVYTNSWHGPQTEKVFIPIDPSGKYLGDYMATSQPYWNYENRLTTTFSYSFIADYGNKTTTLTNAYWSTPSIVVSTGQELYGNITKIPFQVLLQDSGKTKLIQSNQVIANGDADAVLVH